MILDIVSFLAGLIGLICLFFFGFIRSGGHRFDILITTGFWVSGFIFHLATLTAFIRLYEIFLGPAFVLACMFGLRSLTVRLKIPHNLTKNLCFFIGGAGLWLGLEGGLLALILSSAIGLGLSLKQNHRARMNSKSPLHGVKVRLRQRLKKIPMAPVFALGIFIAALWEFKAAFGFL